MTLATDSHFGIRLKALRTNAGMSHIQLAEAAGLTFQAIYRIEKGEREPGWTTVLKLARALGVSVAEFAVEPPSTEPAPPSESEPAAPPTLPRAAGKRK